MTKTATENTAAEQPGAAETMAAPAPAAPTRDDQAMALVKSYVPWSVVSGLVPVPGADMAALLGVQMRMLCKLSEMYGVPFRENGVKGIVTSMLGTVVSASLGSGLGSLAKAVPLVGSVLGMLVVPSMYSAATYAIGRVFVTHFEAGGTFLDFDPKKTRAFFVSEFEKAKAQPDIAKA